MERVIGLGGPFIKADDPKALATWYEKHLGIAFNDSTYTVMKFTDKEEKIIPGYNVFTFFKKNSEYFAPSVKDVMVNFIVKDLFALLKILKEEGVELVGEPMDEEYGKFGWILDPEGNKIELWQPPE